MMTTPMPTVVRSRLNMRQRFVLAGLADEPLPPHDHPLAHVVRASLRRARGTVQRLADRRVADLEGLTPREIGQQTGFGSSFVYTAIRRGKPFQAASEEPFTQVVAWATEVWEAFHGARLPGSQGQQVVTVWRWLWGRQTDVALLLDRFNREGPAFLAQYGLDPAVVACWRWEVVLLDRLDQHVSEKL